MIRLLPQNLVNQIAAGEVVERPASVVKELVENAIDSGASEIEVQIHSGGRDYIAVIDNGSGMTPEELKLAVMRHATSKLPGDNLFSINTFGFRGEALPSIGSIARLRITTRQKAENEASTISVEGGEVSEIQPASGSFGTKVEVSDLFFATPARLKFLKTDRSENAAINEVFERLALSNPAISFSISFDDKKPVRFEAASGDETRKKLERIAAVIGRDFAENSAPVLLERSDVKVLGFAALPTYNRPTTSMQYIFVNGRPVRDRALMGVIRAAYMDFISHDRYAALALFIEVPAQLVDVNVHPAKTEVRFREMDLIRSAVMSAIRESLAVAGYKTSSTVSQSAIASFRPASGYAAIQSGTDYTRPVAGNLAYLQEPIWQAAPLPETRVVAENQAFEIQQYPLGAAKAQVHATYIIAQNENGIVIVDQHAAHERIVYERMKQSIADKGIARQPLLIPTVVELGEARAGRVMEVADDLLKFGLVIEDFGRGAVIVREVPAMLGEVDAEALVRDIADEVQEYAGAESLEKKLAHFSATCACHSSIRAGRQLNANEMNALLRQMESTQHSGQCNHGRPTFVELQLADIEKLFGRK